MLVQTLTNALSASKFLLVMDDVWRDTSAAWEHVLSVPIKNASRQQPGIRVLVTTRFEDLPRKMQASLHQHRVRPLDEEDAWSLLKKQLFLLDEVEIDHLKSIGMEILKSEWKAVLNDPAWSIDGLPQELDNRLYLSYQDLPPPLKQCFLYCMVFPKGTNMPRDLVTGMWISEGFIQPPERNGSSHDDCFENLATEYYRDLIKRNLIEPVKRYSLTGYMCTLNDVVRSFAEYMAREELLVVQGEQAADSGSGLIRRLSIAPAAASVADCAILKKQKSLRTFVTFNSKHLRHLHLEKTDISRLPDAIHKMRFLQYIVLLNCEKFAHLPSSIIKLVHLRSLYITGSNVSAVPKGFGGLTNLRLLNGFPIHVDMDAGSSSWCSLQELAPLSQLRKLTLFGLEKVPNSWMAEKAMISSKGHLDITT
ncbi:putative disease resistance RPP13-like protein 1 [Dichanthelium oligosanthes]|uniref:Putative disease resistance RPP13-like protein 1 n=1 Tax=Dichanthelium oligosanthes TaxID=888268 RepID=A0A1E5UXM4_9POAL|nr:putative disease resistance RPP13-like protein 1 [Dichanthelium oligosanthes]